MIALEFTTKEAKNFHLYFIMFLLKFDSPVFLSYTISIISLPYCDQSEFDVQYHCEL